MARKRNIRDVMERYIKEGNSGKLRAMGIGYVIGVVVVVIFGFIILGVEMQSRRDYKNFMRTAVKTSAKCTSVWSQRERYRTHSRHRARTRYRTVYYANIEYEYNGTQYRHSNVRVSSAAHTGGYITIYISPDNPLVYRTFVSNGAYMMTFMTTLIVLLLVIGSMAWVSTKCFKAAKLAELNRNSHIAPNDLDVGDQYRYGNYNSSYSGTGTYDNSYSSGNGYGNYGNGSTYDNSHDRGNDYSNMYRSYESYFNNNTEGADYNTDGNENTGDRKKQMKDIDQFQKFDSFDIGVGGENENYL